MRRTRNHRIAPARRSTPSARSSASPLVWRERKSRNTANELIDVVAHDLANALTAASLSVSTLYRKGQVTDLAAQPMRVLDHALRQMGRLVSDLRDAGQLTAGRFVVQPDQLVAPHDLIERAREAARLSASAHALEVACPTDLPLVRVDEQRMSQVFANLVGNALRHTPAGGQITLGATRAPRSHEVIFFVRDTGPGISPAQQPFVFVRRWQAVRRPRGGSSGLGLAICKDIVEGHGGRIYLASRLGEGATFFCALPAHRELRRTASPGARLETRC